MMKFFLSNNHVKTELFYILSILLLFYHVVNVKGFTNLLNYLNLLFMESEHLFYMYYSIGGESLNFH